MACDELMTGDELAARVDARRAMEGARDHVLCVRCRCRIPDGMRRDAKYCCERCKRAYRYELRDALLKEIRAAVRAMKRVPYCHCGAAIGPDPGVGTVPTQCLKCYNAEAQRRYRARMRARRGCVNDEATEVQVQGQAGAQPVPRAEAEGGAETVVVGVAEATVKGATCVKP